MPTFKDIKAVENGTRFVNVDLHVHSYGASHDVKDNGMTPGAIVDSAVKQGLSVIAITDHNSDGNVQEAITYAQGLGAHVLVIPGVEVTTAHGHLLVYFAPDQVEELPRFLAKLDLVGPKGADNTHTAKSMADVIKEAYALGGICIAAHIDREKTGFERFAPGFQNWKRDILRSPGLYGLESDSIGALDWYSEEDVGAEAGERKKIFQSRLDVPELKGRHHLAHLQGSDSHTLTQFEAPAPTKPWTRMKLTELTWESFRTALTDPTARVKARAPLPLSIPRVRGLSITGGFLDAECIHFSDNLNCFIGGRGTGKSTAIRALAYAFGINDEFGEFQNCPELVVVYCEDGDGTLYRYERSKGGDISVRASEDGSIDGVPVDAFRVEYFGQGELAEVAKDPLNTPQLLQNFLDRHTSLGDLANEEEALLSQLRENAANLIELESRHAQIKPKRKELDEIETKLKIAEVGKLKEIVGTQNRIASERTVVTSIEAISAEFDRGVSLAKFESNFDEMVNTVGDLTEDKVSDVILGRIRQQLEAANASLKDKAQEISKDLKSAAKELKAETAKLRSNHMKMAAALAPKIADLKSKGLAGSMSEKIEELLRKKSQLGKEIAAIEQKEGELNAYREERVRFRKELSEIRDKMTERRKSQLANINKNLGVTLQDFTVFLHYEPSGITEEFLGFVREQMSGTYFQEQAARRLCGRVTPSQLGDWVKTRDTERIVTEGGVSADWAPELVAKLRYWRVLFELEILAKPPRPTITVKTKSDPPREIAVNQLSDGQRHTILLTIAMLAETNVPLIIDQPEDDLDNAFIASTIVSTLRSVKERRQVILVTHNANIAVLGDSELLLPMQRQDDGGKVHERGSIDKKETKLLVQKILEGGPEAFLRRKEIYGH